MADEDLQPTQAVSPPGSTGTAQHAEQRIPPAPIDTLPCVDPWSSEIVATFRDPSVDLQAVVVVDDTTLGPGFGGVRVARYSGAQEAMLEAQRLAATMTRKHALAELPYGGAKAVLAHDDPPRGRQRERSLARLGEFLTTLQDVFIPSVGMGTRSADLRVLADQGLKVYDARHDPTPWAARGVHAALKAGAAHTFGSDSLDGLRIAIQGAGALGAALAGLLAADGARILIGDLDPDRADRVAEAVNGLAIDPADAAFSRCDVFAPCSIARVLTRAEVDRLQCRLIVGAANDVLDADEVAEDLRAAGITFVPDYVANAGAVIHEHARAMCWDTERLCADVDRIGPRVAALLSQAEAQGRSPHAVAADQARAHLLRARGL